MSRTFSIKAYRRSYQNEKVLQEKRNIRVLCHILELLYSTL